MVTGYIVRYNDSGADSIRTLSSSSTSTYITGLTDGLTYTISVEATSQHLSGESEMLLHCIGLSDMYVIHV